MKTIESVQSDIEKALAALSSLASQLPSVLQPLVYLSPKSGLAVQVSLRHGNLKKNRQIKANAPKDNWSPESDIVFISYEEKVRVEESVPNEKVREVIPVPTSELPIRQQLNPASVAPMANTSSVQQMNVPRVADDSLSHTRELLLALDQAERSTQFVSLKWFRDTFLPQQNLGWADILEERDRVLRAAIDRRWILMSKVPNPKNPQFPVTAIRVNRPLPEVRGILHGGATAKSPFSPVAISGEPMSQTILRERR